MAAIPRVTRILPACLLVAACAAAHAQDYPTKPIRYVVGFPPGGASDAFARILGQKMNETWGQQVVVDNRPGAGGNIAGELVAKSPADGYTLIMVGMSHAVNVSLYSRPGYDPIKDFAPVSYVASAEMVLVAHPSLPVRNVQELLAIAKRRPGELNYGSGGSGAPGHLAGELFKMRAGVQMTHVPYKGAQSMIGLAKGDHTVEFNNLITVGAHIKSNKVRVLASCGTTRSRYFPDAPTVSESGVPGFEIVQWFGALAPANTPRAIVDKLSAETNRILKLPDVQDRMRAQGAEPIGSTPDGFATLIRNEVTKWAEVAKQAGMRAE
jgi:tripartite-type tricarboxylate transporter receptor subunit TctC